MKIFTYRVNNKRLLLLFLALLISFFVLLDFLSANAKVSANIYTDNVSRVEFIKSLGLDPKEEVFSEKEIVIPKKFSDVFLNYNEIQKSAGYDLEDYSGFSAKVYTYFLPNFRNETAYVNLIIVDGKIVGGDISSAELNGFMLPLWKLE